MSDRTGQHDPLSVSRELDHRVLDWLADTDHGPLRPLLSATARGADVLAPWVAASLWMLARERGGSRRRLLRAWSATALAALLEDAVVKPATDRGRPDPGRLPPAQRRETAPSTSAFPSGHVGAGVAFAVATPTDVPALRAALALTAAVVAYARVYTGRHYLSDALVGVAMGAAAGWLVRPRGSSPSPPSPR